MISSARTFPISEWRMCIIRTISFCAGNSYNFNRVRLRALSCQSFLKYLSSLRPMIWFLLSTFCPTLHLLQSKLRQRDINIILPVVRLNMVFSKVLRRKSVLKSAQPCVAMRHLQGDDAVHILLHSFLFEFELTFNVERSQSKLEMS
jgi:hypothetical protein